MKKITLLLAVLMISAYSYGQVFTGVNWVNWANEPDYADKTGYAENPYENPEYTVFKAPATWAPVASNADFDATWELLGDANNVSNLTSNGVAGDLYDLGAGNTFGSQWKAVHDGTKVYVLLKYWDTAEQADDNSLSFEIMAQPTSPVRHQPTFDAGVTAEDMAKKNMAYARYVELGGGKALFKGGAVAEYAATIGATAAWGANTDGLAAFLEEDHYWNVDAGVLRAVLVMTLDGALSYPTDANAPAGARSALVEGDVFAFDVKSNALVGGTANDNKVEYFWASDKNNGYASNYYSGHLTVSPDVLGEESNVVFTGVNWVNWGTEPNYAETTYDNPTYMVLKAPASWTPSTTVAEFDATWDILGEENLVSNLTSNGVGGDLFDLDAAKTFGASWKAVHDGAKMYVFLKYLDSSNQADAGSRTFEVMAQPTDPIRHEPTFNAGVAAADVAKQNMAYGRYVELGGGKALFKEGTVAEYAATIGLTAAWGANTPGLAAFLEEDHFWNITDGVLRAVLVMSFDGALSYPNNPEEIEGARTALKVGDVFAFDVKSNSLVGGGTANDNKVEYFWAATQNNGYASNYYSGHLTISSVSLNVENAINLANDARVYLHNGILYVRGNKEVDVEVYNVIGAKLKSAVNVTTLSLQDLNNGIYFIRVNGERQAVKVVKH